jgi:hypothetical protein
MFGRFIIFFTEKHPLLCTLYGTITPPIAQESSMLFNDTASPILDVQGPPPWLAILADDASLQGVVLKASVHGKTAILEILKAAIPLYDFQRFTYRDYVSERLFMESYRASVDGVAVECAVWVHINEQGQADSLMIHHHPLPAALYFSQRMWQQVDDKYRELYLSPEEYAALTRG